jgi:hypothetical protein
VQPVEGDGSGRADRRRGLEIALFNPRTNDWNAHFEFVLVPENEVALIEGKNAVGRVTCCGSG